MAKWKWTGPIWAFVLLCLLQHALADAEADAEPDAQAEADPQALADPEADPQYYGNMRPPYNIGNGMLPVSRPPYNVGGGGRPPTPCELTNQCCGINNKGCCPAQANQETGESCFTVHERKCDVEDKADCRIKVQQKCYDVNVKDCRVVTNVEYRKFLAKSCVPKPLTKCFTYQKKVCVPGTEASYQDVSWTNERLKVIASQNKSFCTPVKTFNCNPVTVLETVTDKIRKPVFTTRTQKRCRMVPIQTESQVTEVPVTRIVYRNVCYNVNVPQCSTSACGNGFCGNGQLPCSQTEYSTQTVCPSGPNTLAGQNCQQVREPLCGRNDGTCNPGYQQCCNQAQQRVCRQVPQRVVEMAKQTVPGTVNWRQECNDYPVNFTSWRYEDAVRQVNRTKQDCEAIEKQECHDFSVPQYAIETEVKRDRVSIMVPACKHQLVTDRYCHTFPTGELECRQQEIQKGFRVNSIKCDRDRSRPFCFDIPINDCRLGTSTNCRLVPKRICRQTSTCSKDPLCSTCNNFIRNGPGFGSCPSSTCGNYYSNDPFDRITSVWGVGGSGPYPGTIEGGGNLNPGDLPIVGEGAASGGSGYYPGDGGSGLTGGGGYYPGGDNSVGQGGYYPGGDDSIGQGGYYPGIDSSGGQGLYPGSSFPSGGGNFYPGPYAGYMDPSSDLSFAEDSLPEENDAEGLVEDEGNEEVLS